MMGAVQHWTAGTWVVAGLSACGILAGLYQLVFARGIEAEMEARREAEGDHAGGYKARLGPGDPRAIGLVFIAIGDFGLARLLLSA